MQYVGITSRDPYERRQEWADKGYDVSKFKVIYSNLTYDIAQDIENQYKQRGYKASAGGPRVGGHVYSVYTF